jgi:hypothetical protein
MSLLLRPKHFAAILGLSGLLGVSGSPVSQAKLRVWLLEMHAKQIELLKIDWGQPGLCTEWDRDFDSRTRSCGRRGKLTERRLPK